MKQEIKIYKTYYGLKKDGIHCKTDRVVKDFDFHRHDHYEFEILKSGRIMHEINGVKEELIRGDVIALSPRDVHKITVIEPAEILKVCVFQDEASGMIANLCISAKYPIRSKLNEDNIEQLEKCVEDISELLKKPQRFATERLVAYTILFITEILSLDVVEQYTSCNGDETISSAMNYISEHIYSGVTLNEVASAVKLNPSYFSRLFLKKNGKTFISYITEQRIIYARFLLESSRESITSIAFLSGFGSFSAFSRAFKSISGITPMEYRNRLSVKTV